MAKKVWMIDDILKKDGQSFKKIQRFLTDGDIGVRKIAVKKAVYSGWLEYKNIKKLREQIPLLTRILKVLTVL